MQRTIASLAMVSTIWDHQRKDYLDCFIPFLATVLAKKSGREINISQLCKDFEKEFGLHVPYHPMLSLINRAAKRGIVERSEGKVFIRRKEVAKEELTYRRLEPLAQFDKIIGDMVSFAERHFNVKLSQEQAEKAFISFLAKNDCSILFAAADRSILPAVKATKTEQHIVCKFIECVYEESPTRIKALVDIALGHIMASSFLCGDVSHFKGKPPKVHIYLDTRFVFRLLGLEGVFRRQAYEELVKLMGAKEGKIRIFRHTYDEIMHILQGSQRWVGNERYDPARASPVLRHFVENNYTQSEVDEFVVKLPGLLKGYSVEVWALSDVGKYKEFQIDEAKLEKWIREIYGETVLDFVDWKLDAVILKDIKSISLVNLLRKGKIAHSLNEAGHLFVTTNQGLAYANRKFEKSEGMENKIFACVTDVFIGTVLWAQSPTLVRTIISKNLIADCYVVLQPDHVLLKKYVERVENLRNQQCITQDEYLLLRSHRLSISLLSDKTLGDVDNFTDRTPEEILEDVMRSARKGAEEERDRAREKQLEAETVMSRVFLRAERISEILSSVLSWSFAVLVGLGGAIGCVLSVFGEYSGFIGRLNIFSMLYLVLTLLGLTFGCNVKGWRSKLSFVIRDRVRRFLIGREAVLGGAKRD